MQCDLLAIGGILRVVGDDLDVASVSFKRKTERDDLRQLRRCHELAAWSFTLVATTLPVFSDVFRCHALVALVSTQIFELCVSRGSAARCAEAAPPLR
jgi:hypothetical protein